MNRSFPTEPDQAWFVAVPKRQEFTEPSFHFGERVKWKEQPSSSHPYYQTGRILGMTFQADDWHYTITQYTEERRFTFLASPTLQLVSDRDSVRQSLIVPPSPWLMTAAAASHLGISATQLRKLRLNGLFKPGHHYRDTSVPGSGKPRWQWHVERCARALAVPPEQREAPAR
jgi:hypothetical protein